MRKADWYFDFISPFAYFAWLRLGEFSDRLEIRHRPILFAGLLNHWGQKGPAEMAPKRAWTYRWCAWWAAEHAIEFRFPARHPFNPLPYLRLAIAAGNTPQAIDTIFKTLWTTGADAADEQVLRGLMESLRVDADALAAAEVKEALRSATQGALEQGVFGVPTLVIDNELFWGADAMGFAAAYLADPAIIATAEMQRIAALPIGVMRKPG
ncbi:MAG TPA: 2-hydroxychromene-2-carboxylate isomerase [Steroidobacteraceae bacterium]|jgi:2-hydroxychromene-2-carboxylate isomerase